MGVLHIYFFFDDEKNALVMSAFWLRFKTPKILNDFPFTCLFQNH